VGSVDLAWPAALKESFLNSHANHRLSCRKAKELLATRGFDRHTMGRYSNARRWVVSVGLFFCVTTATAGPDVQFTDITRSANIDFKHENSATSSKCLVETMGGGVALLDYDNDERLDIFFTNGAKIDDPMPDGKLPDKSDRRFWNRFIIKTPTAHSRM
jgi:hypothetical protein